MRPIRWVAVAVPFAAVGGVAYIGSLEHGLFALAIIGSSAVGIVSVDLAKLLWRI